MSRPNQETLVKNQEVFKKQPALTAVVDRWADLLEQWDIHGRQDGEWLEAYCSIRDQVKTILHPVDDARITVAYVNLAYQTASDIREEVQNASVEAISG